MSDTPRHDPSKSEKTELVGLAKTSWSSLVLDKIWLLAFSGTLIVIPTTLFGAFSEHWVAELFTDLRMQQVLGLVIVVLFTLISRKWVWLAPQIALLGYHLIWVLPVFASPGTEPVEGATSLKVMVANVLTSNKNFEQIEAQIVDESPDVFAIIELGHELDQRLSQLDEYPFRFSEPMSPGNFGIGIYSKYPLGKSELISFNLDDIRSIVTTVQTEQGDYRLIATHPLPPIRKFGNDARDEHLEMLADLIQKDGQAMSLEVSLRGEADPSSLSRETLAQPRVIVVGDFNLTPWSPVFYMFTKSSKLRRSGKGFGVQPTWYAGPTIAMGLKLDHCFISDNLHCAEYRIGEANGSDHRSVTVVLQDAK